MKLLAPLALCSVAQASTLLTAGKIDCPSKGCFELIYAPKDASVGVCSVIIDTLVEPNILGSPACKTAEDRPKRWGAYDGLIHPLK